MLPINETYNNECVIGSNKKVKFRPWKSKDEKAFLTYVETVEEVTDDDFLEKLILPCIEDKNIHLSDADVQMLLIEIRKVSIGEKFEMKFVCDEEKCGSVNEVDVDFDDIVTYKLDRVKEFISKDETLKVKFGEIKNETFFKEKTKGQTELEKTFIELVLRIDTIEYDGKTYDTFKYENAYEFIDNLNVNIFNELLEYYKTNSSNIQMEGDFDCMFCGHKNSFIFDEVPNFLAGW